MLVVSRETCPSQARTVLMSTPARRRWVAVVWRMVWGLIRLASSEGILTWALRTDRSTNVWMPKRVMGRLQRFRKTRAEGERSAMTTLSSLTVFGHRGQQRSLPPLPRTFTEQPAKSSSLTSSCAAGAAALVSIMEGCSKYCTFCVVPYPRGEEISRPFAQVLREVETLSKQGVREVTLLGQNVNAYAGPMEDGRLADLATLIHFIAAVPGVERIRFTTSHPLDFNDSLIEAYANVAKLNNFLHLPVQSGSDRILAAMKRGHTVLEYKQKLRKLRAVRPDICISTDIIVGALQGRGRV